MSKITQVHNTSLLRIKRKLAQGVGER